MIKIPETPVAAAKHTALISAGVNLALTGIKITLGGMAGSAALIADGIHSLADLVTDAIAYAAVRMGNVEADETHPYGHGKFETFGTLMLSAFLAITAFGILYDGARSMAVNDLKPLSTIALYAAGISVLANELLFRYCNLVGKKVNSRAIIANAWHHRADGLSSLAALIGIGLSVAGFPIFDPLAAMVVALVLLRMSYKMGREAFDELVDAAVDASLQEQMLTIINSTDGVLDSHMLRARRLGGKVVVDTHVDVDPMISVSEGHQIAEMVEHRLKKQVRDITDVTVHIDPAENGNLQLNQPSRKKLEATIEKVVADLLPDAEIGTLTLHFLEKRQLAEITLHGITTTRLKKEAPKLRAALEKPAGPFEELKIALSITH